jgi:hypothetical protein
METKKLKNVWFNGTEIKDGLCSTFKCRIRINRFPSLVVCEVSAFFSNERVKNDDGSETKSCGVSLTHTEVMRLLNESDSFEFRDGELKINHPDFVVFVEGF